MPGSRQQRPLVDDVSAATHRVQGPLDPFLQGSLRGDLDNGATLGAKLLQERPLVFDALFLQEHGLGAVRRKGDLRRSRANIDHVDVGSIRTATL